SCNAALERSKAPTKVATTKAQQSSIPFCEEEFTVGRITYGRRLRSLILKADSDHTKDSGIDPGQTIEKCIRSRTFPSVEDGAVGANLCILSELDDLGKQQSLVHSVTAQLCQKTAAKSISLPLVNIFLLAVLNGAVPEASPPQRHNVPGASLDAVNHGWSEKATYPFTGLYPCKSDGQVGKVKVEDTPA
ncbi:hypothetical protein FOZ62_005571, partial [Perkinsus olseni]